eukprot:TRINITY_DN4013_c0_g1_i1.p1 TRINITY_DN4013_c0_g1~~TRINITY_DN4013_c0_g1_i1.p1  ORF type:complete len:882 (-),score=227.68 TRINITY_DN4013_c0_g1_i1:98-2743(-)
MGSACGACGKPKPCFSPRRLRPKGDLLTRGASEAAINAADKEEGEAQCQSAEEGGATTAAAAQRAEYEENQKCQDDARLAESIQEEEQAREAARLKQALEENQKCQDDARLAESIQEEEQAREAARLKQALEENQKCQDARLAESIKEEEQAREAARLKQALEAEAEKERQRQEADLQHRSLEEIKVLLSSRGGNDGLTLQERQVAAAVPETVADEPGSLQKAVPPSPSGGLSAAYPLPTDTFSRLTASQNIQEQTEKVNAMVFGSTERKKSNDDEGAVTLPTAMNRRGSAPPRNRPQTPKVSQASNHGNIDAAAAKHGGESWKEFLNRASTEMNKICGDTDETEHFLFDTFRTTADLRVAFAAFARLYHKVKSKGGTREDAIPPPWQRPAEDARQERFPYYALRLADIRNNYGRQLWKKLDERTHREEYDEEKLPCGKLRCGKESRLKGRRCVVVGAGPIGLRAAIELRLLGATVTVVERATEFSRINQLHLWDWCGDEIKQLGAKCLEPPSSDFGVGDRLNIGIADLQTLLLKTALLLGAEVFLGTRFEEAKYDKNTGWQVTLAQEYDGMPPSPKAPSLLPDVAVVIGSDGFSCRVTQGLGMSRKEMSGLTGGSAIGLVFNLKPLPDCRKEKTLRTFKIAKQFEQELFKEAKTKCGLDLENIVYMKDANTNYFVCTPTKESLATCEILKDPTKKEDLLHRSNIDQSKLEEVAFKLAGVRFSRDVGTKQLNPSIAEVAQDIGVELAFAEGKEGHPDKPRLFDFHSLRRTDPGAMFCAPEGRPEEQANDDEVLFVAAVGDALLEPFWPEGLGIVRGFMGVLDVCSALAAWADESMSRKDAMNEFASSFNKLKSLAAATRKNTLRDEAKDYRLHPNTRYRYF